MATYTVKATGGDYSTLTAWEAAAPATLTEPYEAECYDFACDDDVAIVGITTSATNYIRIYAAASAALDGRSRDVSGVGFQLFRSSGATAGILRVDANYFRVEGIEFTNKGTTGYTLSIVATRTAGANDVRVTGCVIHDVRTGTQYTCSITAPNLNLTLTNNIIYGYQRTWDTRGAASVVSNNNTIWRHADQIGVVSQTELVCKNTYSGRASGTSECFWTGGSSPSGNNNASSDNSAATDYTASLTSVAGAAIFRSITPGAEDFRLVTGAALIDAGVTLTVANDIAGTTRPSGSAWDIGAWEFVSSGGGTVYSLVAGSGVFALAGQQAGLTSGRHLPSDAGAFALAGQNANLSVQTPGGYSLTADHGGFALAGQAAGFAAARKLGAGSGSFALTGRATTLLKGKRLTAAAGNFAVTGIAAAFKATRRMAAGAGAFVLTGMDATLTALAPQAYTLSADAGFFVLTGSDVTMKKGRFWTDIDPVAASWADISDTPTTWTMQ